MYAPYIIRGIWLHCNNINLIQANTIECYVMARIYIRSHDSHVVSQRHKQEKGKERDTTKEPATKKDTKKRPAVIPSAGVDVKEYEYRDNLESLHTF